MYAGTGRRHIADRRDLARFGRRVAFIVGTGCGVLTGLLGAFAILHGSFWLFCGATFLGGLYGAVAQSYRFAAADGASVAFRPKAVSWVMAGGVFAGVLGPQLVQWTMDVWPPYLFAFSFVMQAAVALVAMACSRASMREAGAGRSAWRAAVA
jgi:MFS family permease